MNNSEFMNAFLKEKKFDKSLKLSSDFEILSFHNISSTKQEKIGTLLLSILNSKTKFKNILSQLINNIKKIQRYDNEELKYIINDVCEEFIFLGENFQYFITDTFKNILNTYDEEKQKKINAIEKLKRSNAHYEEINNNAMLTQISKLEKEYSYFNFENLVCIYEKYCMNVINAIESVDTYIFPHKYQETKTLKEQFVHNIIIPRSRYITNETVKYIDFELGDFCTLINAYIFYFFESNSNNLKLKICKNCKHYFFTDKRSDTKYCSNISPNNSKLTCREVGAKLFYKESLQSDRIKAHHERIGNRYRQKIQKLKKNNNITEMNNIKAKYEKYKKAYNKKRVEYDKNPTLQKEEIFYSWIIKQ